MGEAFGIKAPEKKVLLYLSLCLCMCVYVPVCNYI
jgi:hypothetical protein